MKENLERTKKNYAAVWCVREKLRNDFEKCDNDECKSARPFFGLVKFYRVSIEMLSSSQKNTQRKTSHHPDHPFRKILMNIY